MRKYDPSSVFLGHSRSLTDIERALGWLDTNQHDHALEKMTGAMKSLCGVVRALELKVAAASELLELAKTYASECAECDGNGWLMSHGRPTDCADCADIRAVIERAERGPQQGESLPPARIANRWGDGTL